jgi:hypothetical protein
MLSHSADFGTENIITITVIVVVVIIIITTTTTTTTIIIIGLLCCYQANKQAELIFSRGRSSSQFSQGCGRTSTTFTNFLTPTTKTPAKLKELFRINGSGQRLNENAMISSYRAVSNNTHLESL